MFVFIILHGDCKLAPSSNSCFSTVNNSYGKFTFISYTCQYYDDCGKNDADYYAPSKRKFLDKRIGSDIINITTDQ